ncbi:MAG: hypothetical protein SGJ21_03505, partial [Alphaproteobacteria bacterium]|nr:hypothetical protein [Alphaproteobacteria bacterium]
MIKRPAALAIGLQVLVLAGQAHAQVGGNLAALPAVDVRLDIRTDASGAPVLSPTQFKLVTGEYYRLTLRSDGGQVWRVEVPDLLQNSHLRVVTINDVEVHLQGMVFRAIEFDAAGQAAFSFTPIRPGTYQLYVGKDPYSIGQPIGRAGVQPGARAAFAE